MNDSGLECITNQCTPLQATCITEYSLRISQVTSQWRSESYEDPAEYITWQVLAHLIIPFNIKIRNKSNKY